MLKRKSNILFLCLAMNICALFFVFVHAFLERRNSSRQLRERAGIVEKYELTDLCLFTDARYTRNPVMADFSTPFQDHPLSVEHFPSGSIISPPQHLARQNPGKI
jgi:hypothetical protein